MNIEIKKINDLNTKNDLLQYNNKSSTDEYNKLADKTEYSKKNTNISIELGTINLLDDPKITYNNYDINLKYGKYKILTYDKNGDPYLVLGPDYGYFYGLLIFNFIVLIFMDYIYICYCPFIIKFIGFILCFIQLFSFVFCSLKNPGLPKKEYQNYKISEKYKRCKECKFIVDIDKNFRHCYFCCCCCEGYDHHCPWTTKCVGARNLFYFQLMIVLVFVIIIYFTIATILTVNPNSKKCKNSFII